MTTETGMTLDSYVVVELDGRTASDATRLEEICEALSSALKDPARERNSGSRLLKRQLKAFNVDPKAQCSTDELGLRTVLEITAADRPGLLASIGWFFADRGVRLQNARIATFGERAEDVFYITDKHNQPFDSPASKTLACDLERTLSEMSS